MEKLYPSKTFWKMAGGRMHTLHSTPLDSFLAKGYKNYQKSWAYFCHLAPLVLSLLLKGKVKRGGGGGGIAQRPRF